MFFNRNQSGGVNWILVGLGNPGAKYESTRHNMGWLALDSLMEQEKFTLPKLRFKAWTGIFEKDGNKILVMKPQTYMNLSGESVGEAARFYKVPADHVVVISDDVSLPVGKLRIRKGGSAGGHNGLKNIIAHLGTDQFPRIKVGVGMPEHPDHEMIDWVIGKPKGDEAKLLRQTLDRAANAALCRRVLELDAYRAAHTLLLYAAFGGEADLATVAAEAVRQGKTVAYPVCGEGFTLIAAVPGADGWAAGQYGIRAPVPERSALLQPEQLDLVLVPCTAFDADCRRVGMGKGYYDRYLPRCTRAVKIGIALEVQRVPRAAVDAHDQRLDAFVTERGIYTWK